MNLLIRGSQILLPDGEFLLGDVLVENGKISEISTQINRGINREDVELIEAEGLTLLAGAIDPQVHFREPGLEHKEDLYTASCACAKGGITSFLEMPNTKPLTTDQAALDDKLQRASEKCLVNYGFFIGANGKNIADLNSVNPTCGIKIFMGSMKGDLLIDQSQVLEEIFANGDRLIAVHAEDQERITARRKLFQLDTLMNPDIALHSQIQDNEAALLATIKAVELSHKYNRRLHILHLSTAEEVAYLRQHKTPLITAEVTPQHLVLNINDYDRIGTFAQMNPPLRSPYDNKALWQGLQDGILDFIATDHAPHTLTEKAQPYPNSPSGMPGVETSLAIMLTQAIAGRCTVAQVSKWMSSNVAEAYGIVNKGKIAIGYDADLVLVNLQEYKPVLRADILSKCGWSPFEGWNLTGWAVYTIVGGAIAFANGKVNPEVRGQRLKFSAP
jgi:dihydroorotase